MLKGQWTITNRRLVLISKVVVGAVVVVVLVIAAVVAISSLDPPSGYEPAPAGGK